MPKFEIFDDRIEITSAWSIPPGVEQDEFFQGYSIPRNKILMRIFKDLDMVEYLGSGMPRILKFYKRDSYIFTANFIRTVFSNSSKIFEPVNGGVNEKESILIMTIDNLKTANIKELSKKTYIPVRTIERLVSSLKNRGVLTFSGAPKTGGYTLTNDGLEILKNLIKSQIY